MLSMTYYVQNIASIIGGSLISWDNYISPNTYTFYGSLMLEKLFIGGLIYISIFKCVKCNYRSHVLRKALDGNIGL